MSENKESGRSSVHRIIDETKKYLSLKKDLLMVEGVEKLTALTTALLLLMLAVILGVSALFYFFFALVYVLAPCVGGMPVAFLIAGAIPLLMLIVAFIFRKQLIINPIVNFLANLFLVDSDRSNTPKNDESEQ
ncbi:MAG: phage holin family protein [Coprobacter sp.]|nr:phage holin family protein [Coprobacter sp.]